MSAPASGWKVIRTAPYRSEHAGIHKTREEAETLAAMLKEMFGGKLKVQRASKKRDAK